MAAPVAVTATTKPPTRGAGVPMDKVHVPGKRLRAWHRKYGTGLSLRSFARALVARADVSRGANLGADGNRTAVMWRDSKGRRVA